MATPGAELDKLKRRMIRTVARLLKEKKSQDEVWEVLKHESGSNCKTLWNRMRSLTLKKLRRLQEAEDRVDNIPAFARMSLTDWLMYDLVIVHEDLDEAEEKVLMESPVLSKLFSLVQMYNIEGLSGDALTEAWTTATLFYNSNGYQCSPMLMQRRWYQLKKVARDRFYKFWFVHRGNPRLLSMASHGAPTKLQQAVALKYPEIITKVFDDWEERIEKRLVIMPNEFEDRLRNRQGVPPPPVNDSAPDLVIVEPKIDTICVGDSDEECEPKSNKDAEIKDISETSNNESDENEKSEETQIPIIVNVKSEPQDGTNIPTSEVSRVKDFHEEIEMIQNEEQKLIDDEINRVDTKTLDITPDKHFPDTVIESDTVVPNNITAETDNVCAQPQDSIIVDSDEEDVIMPQIKNETVEVTDKNNAIRNDQNCPISFEEDKDENQSKYDTGDIQSENENIVEAEKNVRQENEEFALSVNFAINQEEVLPVIASVASGEQAIIKTECKVETLDDRTSEDDEDIIMLDTEPTKDGNNQPLSSADIDVLPSDIHLGDGLEFADDGIEYVEEEHRDANESQVTDDSKAEPPQTSPKFDLKLLMHPVVYTTKLDHMNVYTDRALCDTVQQKELIDRIIVESKPISSKSINVDTVKPLPPDNEDDFQDDDLHQGDLLQLEPNIKLSADSDIEVVEECARVKISSHLLQKPKRRSYNPIQLCKNPDFNTRLKRLNVGFFSYSTNRVYLKACKPMTIDVSKAFESKLVDGTMYLKGNDDVVEVDRVQHKEHNIEPASSSTIMPSAVAVQSLMNSTDVDKILQEELKKRMLERNKVISLPSISVVRQINDQLQKAAVAPIMAPVKNIDLDAVEPLKVRDREETVEAVENLNLGTIINNVISTYHKQDNSSGEIIQDNTDIQPSDNFSKAINNIITTLENDNISTETKQAENKNTKTDEIINKKKEETKKKTKRKVPAWFQAKVYTQPDDVCYNDTLLTIDSLYKMLTSLDPNCIKKVRDNQKKLKQMQIQSKQIQNRSSKDKETIAVVDLIDENEGLNKSAKDPIKPKTSKVTETVKRPRRPKAKKNQRCCWCNHQIEKLMGNVKVIPKHTCELNNCKCCCAEKLKMYVHTRRTLVSTNAKITPAEINQAIEQVLRDNKTMDVDIIDVDRTVDPHVTKVSTAPVTKIRVNINYAPAVPQSPTAGDNSTHQYPEKKSDNTINNHQACDNLVEGQMQVEKIRTRVFAGDRFRNEDEQQQLPPFKPKVRMVANLEEESCSCRPNVSVDQHHRTLLIDGSNDCTVHKRIRSNEFEPTNAAKVYVNKNVPKSDTPYYLGKNKILLTNLKRPATPTPVDPSTLLMPEGVNVVVLPDGTITCQLQNPDVVLTPEQLANLPIILNAIKEEINAIGITLPVLETESPKNSDITSIDNQNVETSISNESVDKIAISTPTATIIDITEDNTELANDAQHGVSKSTVVSDIDLTNGNVEQNKTLEVPSDAVSDIAPKNTDCVVIDKSQTESNEALLFKNQIPPSDETIVNAAIAMEQIPLISEALVDQISSENMYDKNKDSVTSESNSTKDSDPNAVSASTSRNLLSDLMEMSGILEEDVPSTTEEPALQAPNETIAQEAVVTSAMPLVNLPLIAPLQAPPPGLPIMTQPNVINEENVPSKNELYTVTCFADLRYACDNNGLFFKLDMITGKITPINVCIQQKNKTFRSKGSSKSDVIDLTDDHSVINVTEPSNLPGQHNPPRNIIVLKPRDIQAPPNVSNASTLSNNLKPMKMLQSLQQRSNHMMRRILDRRKRMLDRTQQTLQRSRRKYHGIDVRIDMVDSDAPMEEEYLESSAESSDDEPLAKVARKMRGIDREANDEQSVEDVEGEDVEMVDFEELLDGSEQSVPTPSSPRPATSPMPVPGLLLMSSPPMMSAIRPMGPPTILNSVLAAQEAHDDSEDDCILGV